MVDEYLTDDEQGEALKAWWRDNWAWVMSGIVIGLGLLVGWQYYQRYTVQRAEAASAALQDFAAAQVNDKTKAEALAKDFADKYAATPYAAQAQLLLAQQGVQEGDLAKAESALRTVMADGKDAELAQVAKLRLARVLVEQGKSDEAMTLLDVAQDGTFAAQAHEIRGDALYAKKDENAARAEYAAALAAYQKLRVDTTLLELKLEDLGGAPDSGTSQEIKK